MKDVHIDREIADDILKYHLESPAFHALCTVDKYFYSYRHFIDKAWKTYYKDIEISVEGVAKIYEQFLAARGQEVFMEIDYFWVDDKDGIPIDNEGGKVTWLVLKKQWELKMAEEAASNNRYNRAATRPFKTYIILNESTGYYKIGRATDVGMRFKTLQADNPKLKTVRIFSPDIESKLHREFKHKRLGGEWFELTEKDLKYIDYLVKHKKI